jgi:hypothetical protein
MFSGVAVAVPNSGATAFDLSFDMSKEAVRAFPPPDWVSPAGKLSGGKVGEVFVSTTGVDSD